MVGSGTPGTAWPRRGGAGARSSEAAAARGDGTTRDGARAARTAHRERRDARPGQLLLLAPRLCLESEKSYIGFAILIDNRYEKIEDEMKMMIFLICVSILVSKNSKIN